MKTNFTKIPLLYFDTFLHKFMPNEGYHWIYGIGFKESWKTNKVCFPRNAQVIFCALQKETSFKDIILLDVLGSNLNFLNQEARDLLSETETITDARILANDISDKSKAEILNKFKNHEISKWDFDVVLFSCGVACCMNAVKSPIDFNIHFLETVYNFLLNNRFALQFYYFLKNNKILLIDKKQALFKLYYCLNKPIFTFHLDGSVFLENFILIYDLLEYPHEELLELKKNIKQISDIDSMINSIRPVLNVKIDEIYEARE